MRLKLCSNCGKYPFCGKCYTPTDCCDDWVKQDYDIKLVKVDGLNYMFERIDE